MIIYLHTFYKKLIFWIFFVFDIEICNSFIHSFKHFFRIELCKFWSRSYIKSRASNFVEELGQGILKIENCVITNVCCVVPCKRFLILWVKAQNSKKISQIEWKITNLLPFLKIVEVVWQFCELCTFRDSQKWKILYNTIQQVWVRNIWMIPSKT